MGTSEVTPRILIGKSVIYPQDLWYYSFDGYDVVLQLQREYFETYPAEVWIEAGNLILIENDLYIQERYNWVGIVEWYGIKPGAGKKTLNRKHGSVELGRLARAYENPLLEIHVKDAKMLRESSELWFQAQVQLASQKAREGALRG